jgi:hypothetical protein
MPCQPTAPRLLVLLLALSALLAGCGNTDQAARERKTGEVAAHTFIEGWERVTFPTKIIFDERMRETLGKLPAGPARQAAQRVMVAYLPTVEHEEGEGR